MSLISFSPLADGVTAVNAAATNTPLSTIYNDYNGNITNANISASAAIAGSKVNLASIANPYKFSVYRAAAWTTGGSITSVVPFDTKTGTGFFDTGNNFDVTTNKGRFTAPIAGFYFFSGYATAASIAGGVGYGAAFLKNGSQISQNFIAIQGDTAGFAAAAGGSMLIQCAANDYVEFTFYGSSNAGGVGAASTGFQGFLVSAT